MLHSVPQERVHETVRVALDAGFLSLPPSGIGSYVRGLAGALAERDDIDLRLLAPPALLDLAGTRLRRMAWDTLGVEISRLATARDTDLLHVPALSAPVRTPSPLVVTVHDVIPLVLPEYRASRAMRVYLGVMRRSVRRARIVLAPSHFSAAEAARALDMPRERFRVTPLAIDPDLGPADDLEGARAAVSARFGVGGRYLLHMAGFDRRKQVPLLVRAFARALPHLPDDVTLVLAGAPHSENATVFPSVAPVIAAEGVADRVVLTGWVTNAERRLLYQGALGYVTPSLYEGFGLTPLEAMACGTPVIAARRASLPEVVGDAGLLVEPELDAVSEAIARLVGDERLRMDLSARGLERAAAFTWARTVDLTVVAYHEAIALGP